MDNWEKTYKKYLNNLPKYKAPGTVWKRLEVSIFSIDKSVLPVYRPSENLWKRIEKSYLYKHRIYRWTAMILILLALAIPGTMFYNSTSTEEAPILKNDESHITSDEAPEIPAIFPDESENITVMEPVRFSGKEQPEIQPEEEHIATNHSMAATAYKEYPETSISPVKPLKAFLQQNMDDMPKRRNRVDECSPFRVNQEFLFGPYYEYQYFLEGNNYMQTKQKYWHSFGVNARLNFSGFYIESGLGLSLSKDKIHWDYDYVQNELINTYVYVDSVFYDPMTGETYFYTSLIEVYDSVSYTRANTINKSHYYLKVPFFAGVNLFRKRNFCSNLSGGIIYNFLIQDDETTLHYSEPNARIIKINYEKTRRLKHNFNAALRMNFEWTLNRKFLFYVYPSVNYYLNPLYDGSGAKSPLTLGFGAGVYFR